MYKSDYEIKKELCEIGRRIYNDGFVAANDGNFSVKIDDDINWTIDFMRYFAQCFSLN